MPTDFYDLGADDVSPDEVRADRTRVENLSAVPAKKSSTAAWSIGIGLALFVGFPILLSSITDLVRASKE